MDENAVEKDVVNIDILDPVGGNDVVIIPEGISREDPRYAGKPISVSDSNPLGTGNILKQVFNLIAQIRSREYWNLDEKEIKSLNKTCPNILPRTLVKNSGLIGCVLSVLGIIVKRLKLERQDAPVNREPEMDDSIDPSNETEQKGLTGGRTE